MRYLQHTAIQNDSVDNVFLYREELKLIVETRDVGVHEGALTLPFVDSVSDIDRAKKYVGEADAVFLVGIGGSSLGTEAVFQALSAQDANVTLTVFDTVSSDRIERAVRMLVRRNIPKEKIAIIIISKSGGTTETITNASMLSQALSSHYSADVKDRTLVITDQGSRLDTLSHEIGYEVFHLPHAIGGRFSVFSNVGLIPLALLGVDTAGVLRGAREAITSALADDSKDALDSVYALSLMSARGLTTLDTFVFDASLEAYAKWRRQLLAESLGKSKDMKGNAGMFGILPTVTTAGDLHSVAQLYLSGARGIHTDFITFNTYGNVPITGHPLLSIIPYLEGKTTDDILRALSAGVLEAYADQQLSYAEYRLVSCNAYEIGALMAHNMFETICAAKLLKVNAFDQPNVELYKIKTKARLEREVTN